MFETVPEDLREILSFKLTHQLLIDATDKQFSEDSSSIYSKDLLLQLFLYQSLSLVL